MTTGIVPDGAGRACSLVIASRAASRGHLVDVDAVEDLEPDGVAHRLVAGLHAGVAVGDRRDAERGPRTCSSPASTPSVLATRTRLRLSP